MFLCFCSLYLFFLCLCIFYLIMCARLFNSIYCLLIYLCSCVYVHLVYFISRPHGLSLWRAPDWASILPRRVFSKRSYMRDILSSVFGYIEWKPGRKFRSRIRMDGSAVCTRDTTPRTETRLSVDPHLCRVWINFVTIYLIAWFLSNVSLHLAWHWQGYPTSPTRAF